MAQQTEPDTSALIHGLEAVGREIGATVRGEKLEPLKVDVKGKGKETQSASAGPAASDGGVAEGEAKIWLHCSVGDVVQDDDEADEAVQVGCSSSPHLCQSDRSPQAS